MAEPGTPDHDAMLLLDQADQTDPRPGRPNRPGRPRPPGQADLTGQADPPGQAGQDAQTPGAAGMLPQRLAA
jgi:hypothetical protein